MTLPTTTISTDTASIAEAPTVRTVDGPPRVAVLPAEHERTGVLGEAVGAGGGRVVGIDEAEALVWATPDRPDDLREVVDEHPDLVWVQLPFAGVEPFADVFDDKRTWTSGKGVYAEPVAEHALALLLAGLRNVGGYARETTWSAPVGRNLLEARVTILGGGDITRSLLRLVGPFGCHVTVVRRHPDPLDGADRVIGADRLGEVLPDTDALVLALALTDETTRIVDADVLAALPEHAWLVNVARGRHVDTDALVEALTAGTVGGAALDVTDPEPLPDGHPLWDLPNAIVTPHIGNTPAMGLPLLCDRITRNVARFADGRPLLGPVDPDLGY